jgi:hypothetical protein
MSGKITNFFREYVIFFSSIVTIFGFIVFFIGLTGTLFPNAIKNIIRFTDEFLDWSLYLLIIGFIILASGIWYLYNFLKNRKFILDEIKTNKRSELLKKHSELKTTVKHLPSKYKKMLKEKENELNIK